jgi:pimeloyl-ACP methyl ester carboxylesterase
MPFERIHQCHIYYERHGGADDREAIVLLHHGFGCTTIWKEIYPFLVKQGYQVLMYDRRGYGQSEAGPGFMDFYMSDRYRPESVEEMAALIKVSGLERFHVIGQCEGGVVGADYAAAYPDQVMSMVIASTQCFSPVPMTQKNASDFPNAFNELEMELQLKMKEWHGEKAAPFFDQFRRFGGAYGKDMFDLRPVLSKVQCPALVLYPDRSAIFEVEQGVAMYRALPKGELSVMPRCGHNTYQYRPEEYVHITLDFFTRNGAKTSPMPEMTGMSCLAVKPSDGNQ